MSGPSPVLFSTLNSTPPRWSTHNVALKPRHHHHIHHPHHRHHKDHGHVPQPATGLSTPTNDFSSSTRPAVASSTALRSKQGRSGSGGLEGELPKDDEEVEWGKEPTWDDVKRVKEKRRMCEENLRNALSNLSTLGTTTTRRLDYTYYSLLSSIPSLRETLSQLSNLSKETAALRQSFSQNTIPSLLDSTSQQTDILSASFENETGEKIKGLEKRMSEARERAGGLGKRVEGVRKRVEAWEARRIEGRRRSRRRLGMLWGFLGSLVGLFLAVLLVRNRPEGGLGNDVAMDGEFGWARGEMAGSIEREGVREQAGGILRGHLEISDALKASEVYQPSQTSTADDVDPRLRIFDEL